MELVQDTHGPAAAGSTGERIDAILAAFDRYDGRYRRAEVDEAIALRERIALRLIEVIEDVGASPEAYLDENRYGHLYAVELLGFFRETRAHAAIVEVFALPGDLPDRLFGDVVTEDLPGLLHETSGGDLSRIRALAERHDAGAYVRIASAEALAYGVLAGAADRVEVLRFLASLLDPGRARSGNPDFPSLIATTMLDLHPAEVMDEVRLAFDRDWIGTGWVGPESFDEALGYAPDVWMDRARRAMRRRLPPDFHDRMDWWNCFDPPEPSRSSSSAPRDRLSRAERRRGQEQRRKRKQDRASRRKNRRR